MKCKPNGVDRASVLPFSQAPPGRPPCPSVFTPVSTASLPSLCPPPGGAGVVSDAGLQAGAAAAAAADGAAGEPRRARATGQEHQHHAGHRHRPPGVRVDRRQVRRAAHAQPAPPGGHRAGRVLPGRVLAELGPPAVCVGEDAGAGLNGGRGG